MDSTISDYRFRTINQSISYKLTSGDVIVGHRKGFTHTVHSIPVNVFNGHHSTWETTNSSWLVLVVVSALSVAFGIWGLIEPESTGMYSAIAVGLIAVGLAAPICSWRHRKLNGVTFSGESNYSLTVISHAAPPPEFRAFVEAMHLQINAHKDFRSSS